MSPSDFCSRSVQPGEAERYLSHAGAREAVDSLLDVAGSLTEELFALQEVRLFISLPCIETL